MIGNPWAPRALAVAAALGVSLLGADAAVGSHAGRLESAKATADRCAGGAPAILPTTLFYELRSGAFPGSGRADVAVHLPPGFDPVRRPGLVVYFHGWRGCVQAALATNDVPCADDGAARTASDLGSQLDASGANALLVAVELRADRATGEPGQLATPGGLRVLLRELFTEHLAAPLGRVIDVDALDRVVLVAHSGGYQAAAAALSLGDVPRVTEVALLDALYGGDDIFRRWIVAQAGRFDPRASGPMRFVDLYTCCGGTLDASEGLARDIEITLGQRGLAGVVVDDRSAANLDATALTHPVVFKRVAGDHGAVPRAYLRGLAQAAGFAPRPTGPQEPTRCD